MLRLADGCCSVGGVAAVLGLGVVCCAALGISGAGGAVSASAVPRVLVLIRGGCPASVCKGGQPFAGISNQSFLRRWLKHDFSNINRSTSY